MTLTGRRAVVTGGNRGIGLATVRALAQAGAEVTFASRSRSGLDAAAEALRGMDVQGVLADVTDRAAMAALLSGRVDILINNAGVIDPIGHLADVSTEDWARSIEVNLIAAVHAIRCVLPGMVARGGGTVVNLSSGAAHGALEGWSAYCAGKAGLAMVTRSVALEYGARGVRVFGVSPGVIDTGMQGRIRASGLNPVSQLARSDLASAEEPARAIAWLCTPEADGLAGTEVDIRHEALRRAAGPEVRS